MLISAIKQQIESELKRLDALINFTERRLGRINFRPAGTLVCQHPSEKTIVYYENVCENGKNTRTRIGGPEEKAVQEQKRLYFYQQRLKRLQGNRKVLMYAASKLEDYSTEAIHKSLPGAYRCLPDDCFTDDEHNELKKWVRDNYRRNTYELPDNPNIACDGTETRSKGETIIYDDLYYSGLEFMYDSYHKWRGRSGTVHGISPDFLFKCKDGTLLVWEHLGLLGDGQYSDNMLEKLNKYLDCGFTAGENLFITSDNADGNTNELAILDTMELIERRIDGTDHKSERKLWAERYSSIR